MALLFLLACSPEAAQTEACARFVSCVHARDPAVDTLRFEAAGDCWGSPAGADLCDRACVNGLAFLRSAEPTLPDACAP